MQRNLEETTATDILAWAVESYGDRVAVSTSFQDEGMVIVDIVARLNKKTRVLTLDTGRLPAATYQMIETVRERYGLPVEIVFPDSAEVESMVSLHGPNLFYRETAMRMLCCNVRKVRPLERKLKELEAWAVGLRRSQNESRADVRKVDWDASPVKISPLADWTREQVDQYIRDHDVPRHPLYAAGYTSIGCDPCTRAAEAGEGERAGRWWWEQDTDKECGIHVTPDGRVQRTVDVLLEQVLETRRA